MIYVFCIRAVNFLRNISYIYLLKLWQLCGNKYFTAAKRKLKEINSDIVLGDTKMKNKMIYIADSQISLCNEIKDLLLREHFSVKAYYSGTSLLEAFRKKQPDMFIIDSMMPDIDGYSICSCIRKDSHVPIIIVSARDSERDKIAGLSTGSDDYLAKPFSHMELVARIKNIFRRIELSRNDEDDGRSVIKISDILLHQNIKLAECMGKDAGLTTMEFTLLTYLAKSKNRAVSRNELLEKIWGFESKVETRATDDMIKRIRKKLTAAGSKLKIGSVWGIGYMILD